MALTPTNQNNDWLMCLQMCAERISALQAELYVPQTHYVDVLTLNTSQCDCIYR